VPETDDKVVPLLDAVPVLEPQIVTDVVDVLLEDGLGVVHAEAEEVSVPVDDGVERAVSVVTALCVGVAVVVSEGALEELEEGDAVLVPLALVETVLVGVASNEIEVVAGALCDELWLKLM